MAPEEILRYSMVRPLVSVIINNCNYARFVGAAIDSALAQTYRPLEVVVVDDGSVDASREVISSYGERVCPVLKANGGQGSAYNAGFEASSGELILFLDSDDLLDENAIEEAVKLWEPGVAKIHFYLRIFSDDGGLTSSVLPANPLAEGDLREQILKTGYYIGPPSSGNLYSRQALAAIMPIPEKVWPKAADTFPVYLTPFEGQVRACCQILGSYRIHGSNQGAQSKVDGKLMRYNLEKEQRRDRMLSTFCAERGISYTPGTIANNFHHLKTRIASFALDAKQHPYPEDRKLNLALRTLRYCWAVPGSPIIKKLSLTAWIAVLMTAPAKYRRRAVEMAFLPTKRLKLAQQVVAAGACASSRRMLPS